MTLHISHTFLGLPTHSSSSVTLSFHFQLIRNTFIYRSRPWAFTCIGYHSPLLFFSFKRCPFSSILACLLFSFSLFHLYLCFSLKANPYFLKYPTCKIAFPQANYIHLTRPHHPEQSQSSSSSFHFPPRLLTFQFLSFLLIIPVHQNDNLSSCAKASYDLQSTGSLWNPLVVFFPFAF